MNEPNTSKLAALIDADNASASNIEYLINEISRYGEIIANRIYGDFTLQNNYQCRKFLQKSPIKPIQKFRNTGGKNASNNALIIDMNYFIHSNSREVKNPTPSVLSRCTLSKSFVNYASVAF